MVSVRVMIKDEVSVFGKAAVWRWLSRPSDLAMRRDPSGVYECSRCCLPTFSPQTGNDAILPSTADKNVVDNGDKSFCLWPVKQNTLSGCLLDGWACWPLITFAVIGRPSKLLAYNSVRCWRRVLVTDVGDICQQMWTSVKRDFSDKLAAILAVCPSYQHQWPVQ